jgi:hypothetical protein
MLLRSLVALGVLAALSGHASAADRVENVSIPFADSGGIDEWHAVDDKTVYLRSRTRQWYKAELFAPCNGLGFATAIGYVPEPTGSFDKNSSIVVDGQRCKLMTLQKSEKPEPKKK